MKTARLGEAEVNPIGIGTWAMGGSRLADGTVYADYERDDEEAAAIRYSIERGQDHIDTAQVYGAGHTEEIVGRAIAGLERARLFLATKIWKTHAASPLAVRRGVEDSLRKLGTDYVDLIYTHAWWDAIPLEVYVRGLNDVVEAGLARSVGVSNFDLDQLRQAVALSPRPIVANQLHYNLLDHGKVTPEMLDYCREQGITIVAYRPVERHLLADRADNPVVLDVARRIGRPVSQVAINWLIGRPGVVTIPKAVSRRHIDENLGALEFELTADERRLLDAVAD